MADAPHLDAEHPFPGLRPFDFQDHEFFFGREQQINALYRLLDFSRFLAVVGSSGSGKSSLVRAGLLPRLHEERAQAGGRRWRLATMSPGDAPTEALASALSSLAPQTSNREAMLDCLHSSSFGLVRAREALGESCEDPIFLIVDQFEELFRHAIFASETRGLQIEQRLWHDRAAHFVELLLEATRKRSADIFVLITIRSDFIGDCAQFPDLPEAVSSSQFLVPSLTRDQRESVIRRPIEKAAATLQGAAIEPALVQRLLIDVQDEVDQLPVLQHCLSRLWENAGPTHQLTLERYVEVGEITDSLTRHADEIVESLPGLAIAIEQLFRALSDVDKEGRATRRAVPYARLVAECGVPEEQLRTAIARFRADDCSFLIPSLATAPTLRDDTRIDVGHEALLRHWDRISKKTDVNEQQGWLWDEERDGRRYRALLVTFNVPLPQAVTYSEWWKQRPRTPAWGERYGGQFARVEKLIADARDAFFEEQRKAQLAAQTERESQRRRIRQARLVAAAMAMVALIAVGFGIYAGAAQHRANVAQQRAIAAQRVVLSEDAAADASLVALEEMIAVSLHPGPTGDEIRKDDLAYRQQLKLLADAPSGARIPPAITSKLKPILLRAYGGDIPFSFYVTKDTNANDPGAYAFYGPRIYVSTAMIHFVDNREQLAGILCHVSAHIVNHSGAIADRIANAPRKDVQDAYDRAEEETADLSGATLCAQAGFNPWGLEWLLRKLRVHPSFGESVGADRIAALSHYLRRPEFKRWADDERLAMRL